MANGLLARLGLCALLPLLSTGCSSESDADRGSVAGASMSGEGGTNASTGEAAASGMGATSGRTASGGTTSASGGTTSASGGTTSASGGNAVGSGASGGPPMGVDGQSIYTLECHGDSKDCNLAAVPCLGVASQTPNVAAGWACANRCSTNADCSQAPSDAAAKAGCVSFASASHCVLVCENEGKSFACPDGMGCYTPPKSPVGYCLWQ